MKKKIVLAGSLNMDMVMKVDHHPVPGETILASGLNYNPGGKGANQAFAVGRLGGNIQMIGCVGQDDNGRALKANLARANVDTSTVVELPDVPTGLAAITVDSKGENAITVVSGANFALTPAMVESMEEVVASADFVMTQLETPLDTVMCLARLAKKYGKTMILDPAPAVPNLPAELLAMVDLMKPNETELGILTGMPTETVEEVAAAAAVLIGKGVRHVIVTLGGKGAVLNDASGYQVIPGHKVEVVDTTAAGDSFTAAVVNGLAEGMELEEAICFAHTISAIVVTRPGAQSSVPNAEEVKKVLAEFGR